MVYEIEDLRDGLFADRLKVEAKSPIEAMKKIGYEDIERTTDKGANIIVFGERGSYLYHGKQTERTREERVIQAREKQLRERNREREVYDELVAAGYIKAD